MHLGRLQESAVYFHQARRIADHLDQTLAGFMAAAWGGCRLGFYFFADPTVAKEFLESEIAKPRQAGAPFRRRPLQGDLACAYLLAGNLEGARLLLADVGDEVFDQGAACYGQPLLDLFRAISRGRKSVGWAQSSTMSKQATATARLLSKSGSGSFTASAAIGAWPRSDSNQRLPWQWKPSLPLTIWAAVPLALLYCETGRAAEARPLLDGWRRLSATVRTGAASLAECVFLRPRSSRRKADCPRRSIASRRQRTFFATSGWRRTKRKHAFSGGRLSRDSESAPPQETGSSVRTPYMFSWAPGTSWAERGPESSARWKGVPQAPLGISTT